MTARVASEPRMQKAWFYEEHGPKEVLKLGAIPIPRPLHGQILVRIQAAALNPIDFKRRQWPMFHTDFPVIPGCDMAGVVVDIGPGGASKYKIGDHVFGNVQDFDSECRFKQRGTLAQYVAVEERLVALKPPNLSFEEAAAIPVAAQTAMEGFKNGGYKSAHRVFVVGGAGGIGSTVVQLAKRCFRSPRVVASCSTKKLGFVKSLGADEVVDYTTTKFEEIEEKFDFVFDTIGKSAESTLVAEDGAPVVDISWPPTNTRAIYSSLTVDGGILEELRPFLESGKLKAVIDPMGPYGFHDVVQAFGYLETGRAWGKVVVTSFPTISPPDQDPAV